MVAALRFNQKTKTPIKTVYGVVTTGNNWLFHRLHSQEFAIDTREYLMSEVDQILGILLYIVGMNPANAFDLTPQPVWKSLHAIHKSRHACS